MANRVDCCGTFLILLVSLLMTQPVPSESANILGLFSTFSPSHLVVHMSMMRALADNGHNVTIVTMLKPKLTPHENITLVLAPMSVETAKLMKESFKEVINEKISLLKMTYQAFTLWPSILNSQYEFLQHPNLKEIYENPSVKFDLMYLGILFNDYQIGVAAKLKVPVILSWVGIPFAYIDDQVGNIYDPSYVPSFTVVKEPGKLMDFSKRIQNSGSFFTSKFLSTVLHYYLQNKYSMAFGSDTNLPTYYDVRRRISLLFYNYHSHSEGPIRPTVPQSIEIGGIQIKDKPDRLPEELAKFMDNAIDGAIFFSLGTNVNIANFNPHITEAIFKVLSRQKMRVIWKWDDLENTPGSASNIYFNSWLPQDDILAHPNTKLFITHAGKGGIAEAQYHAVPMVALPVFGDQPGNAEIMVSSGFGVSLEILTLTEESFEQAIREVLQNSTYRENVRKFSALYRDRPLTARQSVVYWTNYVLRHNGAYHLQSPLLHMDFIARHNLDVYAALLLIFIISFSLFIILVRFLVKRICCGKKVSTDKIKKN